MLIFIIVIKTFEIYQNDVKIQLFFNGDLDKDVYMEQPERFVIDGKEEEKLEACQIIIWYKTNT